MNKRSLSFFSIPIIIIAAVFVFLGEKNIFIKKIEPEASAEKQGCVASYMIDSNDALFLQFDKSPGDSELYAAQAGSFKPKYKGAYKALGTAENYRINGEAIAWVDNTDKRIVLDKTYFTDLLFPDATRLKPDEIIEIGKVQAALLSVWPFKKLVSFLLETQIINTYWHISADICLIEEQETAETYTAIFDAKHIYFTNERNVEEYVFAIQIHKETGLIRIMGK